MLRLDETFYNEPKHMDSAQGIVDYLEGRTPKYLCTKPKA